MDVATLLGEAAAAWGDDWYRVVAALSEAVELDPWRPEVRARLGLAQSVLGRQADAKRQLNLALDLDPYHPRYWADLALVHVSVGEYADARSLLEESIARRPDYVWAMVALARCYARLGSDIAMAVTAARAINLDPIGEPTDELKGILARRWNGPEDRARPPGPPRGLIGRVRGFLLRSDDQPPPPSRQVADFLAARDMDLGDRVTILGGVLDGLNPDTADYCVVLETLADVHFRLDHHDVCADYSRRAVAGLRCVRALVPEPRRYRLVEAGRDHDAKAAYGQLIVELFGEEPTMTALVFKPGRPNDVRSAQVFARSGVYDIDRGGNLFVIRTPGGGRVIHEAFDRNDLPLAEW